MTSHYALPSSGAFALAVTSPCLNFLLSQQELLFNDTPVLLSNSNADRSIDAIYLYDAIVTQSGSITEHVIC